MLLNLKKGNIQKRRLYLPSIQAAVAWIGIKVKSWGATFDPNQHHLEHSVQGLSLYFDEQSTTSFLFSSYALDYDNLAWLG